MPTIFDVSTGEFTDSELKKLASATKTELDAAEDALRTDIVNTQAVIFSK